MSEICIHPTLTFASGDRFVICRDCDQHWVVDLYGNPKNPQENQPKELLDLRFEHRIRATLKAFLHVGAGGDDNKQ